MQQGKVFGSHTPARLDAGRVGDESYAHSRRIVAQLPNRVAHDALGLSGQAVIECFGLGPASPFQIELSNVVPACLFVRIELSQFLIQDFVCHARAGQKQEQQSWDKAQTETNRSQASRFSHDRCIVPFFETLTGTDCKHVTPAKAGSTIYRKLDSGFPAYDMPG